MSLLVEDIVNLRQGKAPVTGALVRDMTLGQDVWLARFAAHYLEDFIPAGGSKVKLLVGAEASGKSHLLRYIQQAAETRDYVVVFRSARDEGAKLNDLPALYRLIVEAIDSEQFVTQLSLKLAELLGYRPPVYSGQSKLVPYIVAEGFSQNDAVREIRQNIAELLHQADLSPGFFSFAITLLKDRLISDSPEQTELAWRWFKGERLTLRERRESGLFERLQKTNARTWLDSLLKLIVLSGYKGLVLLIDDLDVLYEKSPESGRFRYTPTNVKDSCELFRQLIDDADLFRHMLVLLAGRRPVLDDEKRGFKSYEALWMRLQTGLIPSAQFNALCDIVDIDQHLNTLGPDFPARLSGHLSGVFERYELKRRFHDSLADSAIVTAPRTLKNAVIENTLCGDAELNEIERGV